MTLFQMVAFTEATPLPDIFDVFSYPGWIGEAGRDAVYRPPDQHGEVPMPREWVSGEVRDTDGPSIPALCKRGNILWEFSPLSGPQIHPKKSLKVVLSGRGQNKGQSPSEKKKCGIIQVTLAHN